MAEILNFPKDFLFGASTSAYQVEGGNFYSDYDDYYPAGIACDHYNRFREDIDLMKRLNLNAYRLSIEWARIEKEEGKFDQKEIDHYREVFLYLKEKEMKTMLTLFHCTLPKWFQKKGAFAKERNIFFFERFAKKVFEEYKDLIDFWIVINEPMVYAGLSYLARVGPPKKSNPILYLKVLNNLAKAHKIIYDDFHKEKKDVLVGIAKAVLFFEGNLSQIAHWWQNEMFINKIKDHLDFIGLNYYSGIKIKFPFFKPASEIFSDIGWAIVPEGLYHLLLAFKKYNLPIYITENGVADRKDELREDFIRDHLFWILKAISKGVDVRGYFHWSLMDNFEWEKGRVVRFGLIKIDYQNLSRTLRESALFYAQIAKEKKLKIE